MSAAPPPDADASPTSAGPGAEVHIRPPLWARIWVTVFAVVWTGLLVTWLIRGLSRDGASPPVLISVVLLVVGLVVCWRTWNTGIYARGDELAVRRMMTRRVARPAIKRFDRGTYPGAPTPVVIVATDDGTIVGPPLSTLPFGRRATEQVDAQVAELNGWLRAG